MTTVDRGSQAERGRRLRGLAAALLCVVAAAVIGGCSGEAAGPAKSLRDRVLPQSAQSGSSRAEKKDPADGGNSKVVPVRTLDVRTEEAQRALERNYAGFLQREDTGVSREAFETVTDRVGTWIEAIRQAPESLRATPPRQILMHGIPLIIVAAFIGGFFALTRQIGRFSHRAQARLHLEVSRWTTRLLRGSVLVVGRTASVAILVGLSYFPVQALFNHAPWTRALTDGLWLLLVYRAITSLISITLSGRLIELSDREASRLERFANWATSIVFTFLIALAVMRALQFEEGFRDIVHFGLRVTLVSFPIAMALMKDAVTGLLPEKIDSRLYGLLRSFLTHNYTGLMGAAAVVLALRAAGFVRASSFIIGRGSAILAVLLFVLIGGARLRNLLGGRVDILRPSDEGEAPLEPTDQSTLTRRLEQLLSIAAFIVVVVLVLELLLLAEPTVILLRTPFLAIGQAQISLFNLLNVGFVIFGTVLGFKLLRAVLNAKVYPLFEVDIGVAYAVNTVVKYVIILMAFLLGLSALGINLTAITVVLASLGVGIGFGLQNLVENLISGFIILFGRSVQKGDFITVEGTYGQVEAVGARSVVVTTPDNYEMLIPSKEIVGGRIINWSYEDNTVRAKLKVGVSYKSEPRVVESTLIEATRKHPEVMEEPEPRVRLSEFGDSSINFEVLFFFDCRNTTERMIIGEINFDIWEALADKGIEIPFPQRDLHFKSGGDWERLKEVAERMRQNQEADGADAVGADAEGDDVDSQDADSEETDAEADDAADDEAADDEAKE